MRILILLLVRGGGRMVRVVEFWIRGMVMWLRRELPGGKKGHVAHFRSFDVPDVLEDVGAGCCVGCGSKDIQKTGFFKKSKAG